MHTLRGLYNRTNHQIYCILHARTEWTLGSSLPSLHPLPDFVSVVFIVRSQRVPAFSGQLVATAPRSGRFSPGNEFSGFPRPRA